MAKKTTAAKKGTVQVSKGSQDIRYTGLFSTPEHKLRVEARYDSYRAQSFARIERWDGTKWQELYSVEGAALLGWSDGIAYRPGAAQEASFDQDVAFLLARASEVLGF